MWKRWKPFHATDFQSLMYPCFTFCRLLGIFPYKINFSTFEISKLQYILSSVVICILCIYNGIVIDELISKTNIISVNRTLETVCFFMLSCLIMIMTHVLSGPRMRLLQTILKVSSKLPSKSYQKLSRLIHVKDILYPIFLVIHACVTFPKIKFFHYINFLAMMFSIYCVLLVFQINTLYINCVFVLKACFKNINDNLVYMQKLILNNKKLYVPTIGHMPKNKFLIIKLQLLRNWHLMISDTVQMLNAVFSLQILATVVMMFSNITFEVYFNVVRWQNGIYFTFNKEFLDVIFTVITNNIMLILVWACETSKNQAQEIRTTVHDLLNNTNDKKVKNELHLFSLQIMHCKNSFSAKGLTIDATLLAAMTGSITTYMLILIQFLITSHSCDGKSIMHK